LESGPTSLRETTESSTPLPDLFWSHAAERRAISVAAGMTSSETGTLQPERLPRGLPGALQDFDLRFLDFFVRRLLDAGYVVSRIFGRQNQFVELQL
jgi:hypothetical protein